MPLPPHPDDRFAPELVKRDPTSFFGSPLELLVPGAMVGATGLSCAIVTIASGSHPGLFLAVLVFGCFIGLLALGLYFVVWGVRWWLARRRYAVDTGEPYLRPWQRRPRLQRY